MAPRIAENGEKFNFGIRPKNIAPVRTIVQHMISLDGKSNSYCILYLEFY